MFDCALLDVGYRLCRSDDCASSTRFLRALVKFHLHRCCGERELGGRVLVAEVRLIVTRGYVEKIRIVIRGMMVVRMRMEGLVVVRLRVQVKEQK